MTKEQKAIVDAAIVEHGIEPSSLPVWQYSIIAATIDEQHMRTLPYLTRIVLYMIEFRNIDVFTITRAQYQAILDSALTAVETFPTITDK